jgi:ABC-type multidrug transport system ATPase subunit
LNQLLQREHERGRTILLITHDLTRGISLCDTVAILNRGKIASLIQRDGLTAAEFLPLYHRIVHGERVGEAG